jgi:zinc-ribbon domain
MYCRWCGTALPEGATVCPKCGRPTGDVPAAGPAASDALDQAVTETKRAARDLASAAARFTERLSVEMQATAEDPKGTAKRVARKVAEDLDAAREEIEKALRDL